MQTERETNKTESYSHYKFETGSKSKSEPKTIQ
jgi:hypothetical protein